MDQAWHAGAGRDKAILYSPVPNFEHSWRAAYAHRYTVECTELDNRAEAVAILRGAISTSHYNNLSEFARNAHIRNVYGLTGKNLDLPTEFMTCWTPDAKPKGGTGVSIKIARTLYIPVYNLADMFQVQELQELLEQLKDE